MSALIIINLLLLYFMYILCFMFQSINYSLDVHLSSTYITHLVVAKLQPRPLLELAPHVGEPSPSHLLLPLMMSLTTRYMCP